MPPPAAPFDLTDVRVIRNILSSFGDIGLNLASLSEHSSLGQALWTQISEKHASYSQLDRMYLDEVAGVSGNLIRLWWYDPNLPLYAGTDHRAISELARHPNAPAAVVNEIGWWAHLVLEHHPNDHACRRIADWARIRYGRPFREQFDRVDVHPRPDMRKAAAESNKCSPDVLSRLALDRFSLVRRAVAANPNTPSETVMTLASDSNVGVADTVAGRSVCPPAAVLLLAQHSETSVRYAVAERADLMPASLDMLACDSNAMVRRAAASNPRCSVLALEHLACDVDAKVRLAVARNSNANADTLEVLAEDNLDTIYAVAIHPNTSPATLGHLMRFGFPKVRAALIANPNLPPHIRAILTLG